jgi:hypothetical protein
LLFYTVGVDWIQLELELSDVANLSFLDSATKSSREDLVKIDWSLIAVGMILLIVLFRFCGGIEWVANLIQPVRSRKSLGTSRTLVDLLGTDHCILAVKSDGQGDLAEKMLNHTGQIILASGFRVSITQDTRLVEFSTHHPFGLAMQYGDCWCLMIKIIPAPIGEYRYESWLSLEASSPKLGIFGTAQVPIKEFDLLAATSAWKKVLDESKARLSEMIKMENQPLEALPAGNLPQPG